MSEKQDCVIESQYLPCIRYLWLFYRHGTVRMEAHENYQKGSYRNRTHIGSPQGKQLLSIPLRKGKHERQPITEVRIAYDMPWYANHWHAIQTAYGSAPFFIHYSEELRELLYGGEHMLFEFNQNILRWLLQKLKRPATITTTSAYQKIPEGSLDLRNTIVPHKSLSTPSYPQVFSDRLGYLPNLSTLDLLMHLGPDAQTYLNKMAH